MLTTNYGPIGSLERWESSFLRDLERDKKHSVYNKETVTKIKEHHIYGSVESLLMINKVYSKHRDNSTP